MLSRFVSTNIIVDLITFDNAFILCETVNIITKNMNDLICHYIIVVTVVNYFRLKVKNSLLKVPVFMKSFSQHQTY